jgi:muramoyltetrapeptide carboxypeptidase
MSTLKHFSFSQRHLTVFSPSGALLDEAAFDRGVQQLQHVGFEVGVLPQARWREQRFAGPDEARIKALMAACGGEGSSVLMASRGGYGLSRLLGQLDFDLILSLLSQHRHVLCGHSDFTVLQLALLARHMEQCKTKPEFLPALLHGPMVCFDFGPEAGVHPQTLVHFERAIQHGRVEVSWVSSRAQPLLVDDQPLVGPAWGGNLVMLSSLLGTSWLPDVQNGILILEDVNEPVYKIERMLLQLLHAGVLQRQRAVVLGNFSEPAPIGHDVDYNLACAVAYVQQHTTVPILMDFPFGHSTPKACWFQGVGARLLVQRGVDGLSCQLSQHMD